LDDEVEGIHTISVAWNATQDLGWIVCERFPIHILKPDVCPVIPSLPRASIIGVGPGMDHLLL
jgi:hypothetical protein